MKFVMDDVVDDESRPTFMALSIGAFGLAAGMVGFAAGQGVSHTVVPRVELVALPAIPLPAAHPPPPLMKPPTAAPAMKPPAKMNHKMKRGIARGGPVGSEGWLGERLLDAGLSPDQAQGILAMNRVEGGTLDWHSILGFTEGQVHQLGFGGGPEAHVQAFLNLQWRDPRRREAGGGIPGVEADGTVSDVDAYLTWIRERIVGQIGYAADWQGNRQPNPAAYQSHLREAWDGVVPDFGWGMPGGPENQN